MWMSRTLMIYRTQTHRRRYTLICRQTHSHSVLRLVQLEFVTRTINLSSTIPTTWTYTTSMLVAAFVVFCCIFVVSTGNYQVNTRLQKVWLFWHANRPHLLIGAPWKIIEPKIVRPEFYFIDARGCKKIWCPPDESNRCIMQTTNI